MGLTPTHQAFIGVYLHEHRIAFHTAADAQPNRLCGWHRKRHGIGFDVLDFHGLGLWLFVLVLHHITGSLTVEQGQHGVDRPLAHARQASGCDARQVRCE